MTVLGILIVLVLALWIVGQYELSPVSPGSKLHVAVTIPPMASADSVAHVLSSDGVIRSSHIFLIAAILSGQADSLKPGTYDLTPSLSTREIVDLLADGQTSSNYVDVPAGFTAEQIADRLYSQGGVDPDKFLTLVHGGGETFYFDDGFAPPADLEGYLYPGIYRVPRGTPVRRIVRMMLDSFDHSVFRRFPDEKRWRHILTLASMIDREAGIDSDRPIIASVYQNRLHIHMPLQCDATVEYALPEHKPRLMFSDLKYPSSYNTYLHRGLPPGPICEPGLVSIEAAMHPAVTNYLYYVAGPGGASVFSRTLAEQDQAIAQVRSQSANQ